MKSKFKTILLASLFLIASPVFSQNENEAALTEIISGAGFENVSVAGAGDHLFVAYENRLFRFEVEALSEFLLLIAPHIENYRQITILIKNKNIPVVQISMNKNDLIDWQKKVINNAEFAELIDIKFDNLRDSENVFENTGVINSSNMKFDLVVKPTYKFQFGIFSDPVLYQLNFTPHVEFGLWKGMTGLYELTIPLHNDFTPREDSVRTSMIVVNQTFPLSDNYFLSGTVGFFTQNRYGLDLDTRGYFLNGDLSVGLNVGYTGYASFSTKRFYYSDLYLWTVSANIDYRITEYDLTVGLTAGKFLMNDNTIRVDINREFGEIQVGFFAMRSTNGVSNGGVNISIPLFPSKYWKPGLFRIRTTENLGFTYLVKTDLSDLIGLKYDTGFRIKNFIERLNPNFIINYLSKRLN
ncbi:MAG: YjbH domain-containing protein [Melioribacteraceae bacterium]|nr:YjbH domain-containing protein [Melioribacteraceae bacterium]